jgi:hypothetical protein
VKVNQKIEYRIPHLRFIIIINPKILKIFFSAWFLKKVPSEFTGNNPLKQAGRGVVQARRSSAKRATRAAISCWCSGHAGDARS